MEEENKKGRRISSGGRGGSKEERGRQEGTHEDKEHGGAEVGRRRKY